MCRFTDKISHLEDSSDSEAEGPPVSKKAPVVARAAAKKDSSSEDMFASSGVFSTGNPGNISILSSQSFISIILLTR